MSDDNTGASVLNLNADSDAKVKELEAKLAEMAKKIEEQRVQNEHAAKVYRASQILTNPKAAPEEQQKAMREYLALNGWGQREIEEQIAATFGGGETPDEADEEEERHAMPNTPSKKSAARNEETQALLSQIEKLSKQVQDLTTQQKTGRGNSLGRRIQTQIEATLKGDSDLAKILGRLGKGPEADKKRETLKNALTEKVRLGVYRKTREGIELDEDLVDEIVNEAQQDLTGLVRVVGGAAELGDTSAAIANNPVVKAAKEIGEPKLPTFKPGTDEAEARATVEDFFAEGLVADAGAYLLKQASDDTSA